MAPSARISDLVAQDLRQRIDQGSDLPQPLTIAGLAKHYQVSQSPIRTAVEQLLEWKFLLKRENGRLQINEEKQGKNQTDTHAVPSPTQWEQDRSRVMDQMVEYIVLASLAGDEQFLREEATAERFRIGRAYTRQLFSELSGRGLLEHVARRGWRIRPFRLDDMLQYLEIREVLECKALRLAADRLEPAVLQAMLKGNPPPSQGPASDLPLNNDLHGYLIRKSGNGYISDFFQRNGLYFSKLFDLAAFDRPTRREMVVQHREILQALLDGQVEVAEQALATHIRCQQPIVSELLARFREDPDAFRASSASG